MDVAEPPRVTNHPLDMKDAVPGKSLTLIVEATATQPLNYRWEWKSAMDDGEWQSCDVERFPGADSFTPSPVYRSAMKGATAVLSATMLAPRLLIQLN